MSSNFTDTPDICLTSYSTNVFNQVEILRKILYEYNSDNSAKKYLLSIDSNGELLNTTNSRFVSFYKNASVNTDSKFGTSLLVPTDNGYIIYGCAGLAHECFLLYSNSKEFIGLLPKVKNIPPKLYRYYDKGKKNKFYIQFHNGILVDIDVSGAVNSIKSQNPYEGGSDYQLKILELTNSNTKVCSTEIRICNEHTALTGTYGVLRKGPKCYDELKSYYRNIVKELNSSEPNMETNIQYSGVATKLLEDSTGFEIKNKGDYSKGIIKYIRTQGSVINENNFTADYIYGLFEDHIINSNKPIIDPLAGFINNVSNTQQNLLHFVNDSNPVIIYNKDVEFEEYFYDGFVNKTNGLACKMGRDLELNALDSMSELYNNYLHDKVDSLDCEYQWMFCDNALLIIRKDSSYWYIDVIKYSDRYERQHFRQVIDRNSVGSLVVSYSSGMLTIKFNTSNVANPTMVRVYDINSDEPHKPVYRDVETYQFTKFEGNGILKLIFNFNCTYYSNGMLFKTETGDKYISTVYSDHDNIGVPDILEITGQRLVRIPISSTN